MGNLRFVRLEESLKRVRDSRIPICKVHLVIGLMEHGLFVSLLAAKLRAWNRD